MSGCFVSLFFVYDVVGLSVFCFCWVVVVCFDVDGLLVCWRMLSSVFGLSVAVVLSLSGLSVFAVSVDGVAVVGFSRCWMLCCCWML